MRIGVDVAQSCVERAGCGWWADAVARALAAQPDTEVELYHHFGDWINGSTAAGTAIAANNVTSPLWSLPPLAAREFWSRREAGEPLPGAPAAVLATGFHAPRTPGARLLYVIHDLAFLTRPQFSTAATRLVCQEQLLLALARADGLLFVSEFAHREFESVLPGWLGDTGRPWLVTPGASRFDDASAPGPRSTRAPWLFVGSLEPRKNLGTLLDAYEGYAARVVAPRPLVLAGGSGWKSDDLQRRISALAGRLPVTWRGYVHDDELLRLYRTSFALLLPSWHEGFGLPALEAMGQGLPVIASNAGALPEVCGRAAVALIDPAAPTRFAEAMLELDSSPARHAAAAAAGLDRAAAYSWADTAKTILEFARRLA